MMRRRLFLALALLGLALPAFAQQSPRLTLEIETRSGPGTVVIELLPSVAPLHVERITTLANMGAYDGVAFHRVITGFMAQTGDVQHGKRDRFNARLVGTGGAAMPNLPAEFSQLPFRPGVVGMARASDPDSANSQFFIMTERQASLDGQYTVLGQVTEGMEVIRALRTGPPQLNGAVREPDFITRARVE